MADYTAREIVTRTYDWHCPSYGFDVPHTELTKAMHAAAQRYRALHAINDNTALSDDALWVYGDDTGIGVRFDVDETDKDRELHDKYRRVCGERDEAVRERDTQRFQAEINHKNLQEWTSFADIQKNRLKAALRANSQDDWEALINLVESQREGRDRLRTERDDLRRQANQEVESPVKSSHLRGDLKHALGGAAEGWDFNRSDQDLVTAVMDMRAMLKEIKDLLPLYRADDKYAPAIDPVRIRKILDRNRHGDPAVDEDDDDMYGPYGSSPIDVIDVVADDDGEDTA